MPVVLLFLDPKRRWKFQRTYFKDLWKFSLWNIAQYSTAKGAISCIFSHQYSLFPYYPPCLQQHMAHQRSIASLWCSAWTFCVWLWNSELRNITDLWKNEICYTTSDYHISHLNVFLFFKCKKEKHKITEPCYNLVENFHLSGHTFTQVHLSGRSGFLVI